MKRLSLYESDGSSGFDKLVKEFDVRYTDQDKKELGPNPSEKDFCAYFGLKKPASMSEGLKKSINESKKEGYKEGDSVEIIDGHKDMVGKTGKFHGYYGKDSCIVDLGGGKKVVCNRDHIKKKSGKVNENLEPTSVTLVISECDRELMDHSKCAHIIGDELLGQVDKVPTELKDKLSNLSQLIKDSSSDDDLDDNLNDFYNFADENDIHVDHKPYESPSNDPPAPINEGLQPLCVYDVKSKEWSMFSAPVQDIMDAEQVIKALADSLDDEDDHELVDYEEHESGLIVLEAFTGSFNGSQIIVSGCSDIAKAKELVKSSKFKDYIDERSVYESAEEKISFDNPLITECYKSWPIRECKISVSESDDETILSVDDDEFSYVDKDSAEHDIKQLLLLKTAALLDHILKEEQTGEVGEHVELVNDFLSLIDKSLSDYGYDSENHEDTFVSSLEAAMSDLSVEENPEPINENLSYSESVESFLNHPWQEDCEIDFVSLVSENKDKLSDENESKFRSYLSRLKNINSGSLIECTDLFMEKLDAIS